MTFKRSAVQDFLIHWKRRLRPRP